MGDDCFLGAWKFAILTEQGTSVVYGRLFVGLRVTESSRMHRGCSTWYFSLFFLPLRDFSFFLASPVVDRFMFMLFIAQCHNGRSLNYHLLQKKKERHKKYKFYIYHLLQTFYYLLFVVINTFSCAKLLRTIIIIIWRTQKPINVSFH